jgi:hypothetical protein
VIYAAKSTEDRRGSIPDQIADCRSAIDQAGGREVVDEYVDEAFSAWGDWRRATGARPCNQTVVDHFGGWQAGLTLAGLR